MSGSINGYRDLTAWQKAMDLVEAIYRVTQMWPKEELYGLTNQARRAAISVPANSAEGKGRQGAAEFAHHLSMAMGSLHEAETHLLIAGRLGYSSADDTARLLTQSGEVGRLIGGLMRSLRAAQS